jgi:hypothetical protein
MITLVSLSSCSSTKGKSAASTPVKTNTVAQPTAPFPDYPGVKRLPTATPDLPGPN